MRLAIPRETHPGENRAAVTPDTVKKLVRLGADIAIESGAGAGAGFPDEAFTTEGATVESDRDALLGGADMVLRLRKPDLGEVAKLKDGCIHVSYLDPFRGVMAHVVGVFCTSRALPAPCYINGEET